MATYDDLEPRWWWSTCRTTSRIEGRLYVEEGEQVVPVVNAEIAQAVAAGALIVYTQDWHPPDTPHFEKDGGIWPVHCVEDTWGAALHPDLVVVEGEIVRKGHERGDGYSAFSVRDPTSGHTWSTALERILKDREITRIVVVGLATDFCVAETVCDARVLGFPVQVVSAGQSAQSSGYVERREGRTRSVACATRAPRSASLYQTSSFPGSPIQDWHCGQKYALRPEIFTLWIDVRHLLQGRPSRP